MQRTEQIEAVAADPSGIERLLFMAALPMGVTPSLKSVTYDKRLLNARFPNEEAIGITYPGEDQPCLLPNGQEFGHCTNCAWYVVDVLGQGEVYGFRYDDNPDCTHEMIEIAGGHDFPVIHDRFIVDIWISHYTGWESQVVYDLHDPADSDKIREIYGDPACWAHFDPATGVMDKFL